MTEKEDNDPPPMTLDDVRQATPAEEPEEKRMMDFLERSNVTGRSSRYFDAATSIPADVASQVSTKTEEFEDPLEEVVEAPAARQDSEPEIKAVEDELFAITNSINRLHYEMHANDDNDVVGDTTTNVKPILPGRVYQGTESVPKSEGERFAANAGKIFKGYAKKRHFFRRNKSDSSQITSDQHDVESSTKGLKHSHQFSKKMKLASIESLQEFKSVLSSKKGYVWTYVRDSLFFVIIPSTILAAV